MPGSQRISAKLVGYFIALATAIGVGLDAAYDSRLDYWVHDPALVQRARQQWRHVAVVVMDDRIPIYVSRIQALPLFALASDRLAAAGAKAMFMDARVPKELEGRMPYAACIATNGDVHWSMPECSVTASNQCQVLASPAGTAPLRMSGATIQQFNMAPFPPGQGSLPDFLLFDFDAAMQIPAQGLEASDRLMTRQNPIARWIDLSNDHAVLRLAASVDAERLQASLADSPQNELCDDNHACRRIRLSHPLYAVTVTDQRLFLPLSKLASCDPQEAMTLAERVKNKAVIFQVTSPTESTDTVITPMTTAIFGPKLLTPGAQYLADGVETLLNGDYPRTPGRIINAMIFFGIAVASVLTGVSLSLPLLWVAGILVFSVMVGLCFINPIWQLWPVTASLVVFAAGAIQTTGARLIIGFREGKLVSQYLPKQVHALLIKLKTGENFRNTCNQVVVLMSDLESYTNITGILKEPENLLNLMNDYLNETSLMLQDKYHGWLECYVADMLCYYWPVSENEQQQAHRNALQAAIELSQLQQQFFAAVPTRYAQQFSQDVLDAICNTIDAGIGLTTGRVVMGDLGPKSGVKKFGILGDPLNLVSRVEALTRHFNTEIIISEALVDMACEMGLSVRRLGYICVKGRNTPNMLYALGLADDVRFSDENIAAWEAWLTAIEQHGHIVTELPCPALYQRDHATIESWLKQGLLTEQGMWQLREK